MNIESRDKLRLKIKELQASEKLVGFTSGIFDIVHAGHLSYLEEAKKQCDFLVVGVNSDSSTKSLKGEARPILTAEERATLIAGLKFVDAAFIFNELNNNENIRSLKPDIYFKAGDYSKDKMTSARIIEEQGGKVVLLPFVEGRSTSSIIETVLDRYQEKEIALKQAPYQKRPAVFLDRDGTLNKHIEYLHEPEKFELLPGVLKGLKRLQDHGFRLVVVTNQPGIGLGYFTKEDFFRVNKELFKVVSKEGILIDRIYYSPYSKADNTPCRKPGRALIDRAVQDLNIDLSRSYVVGDMSSDIKLAKNIDCKGVLVKSSEAESAKLFDVEPDFTTDNFSKAAEWIVLDAGEITLEEEVSQFGIVSKQEVIKLEELGEFAGKVGHDFNNILGALQGCTDLLEVRLKKAIPDALERFERQFKIMRASLAKALIMTTKLRSFVRPGELALQELKLSDCVKGVVELLNSSDSFDGEIVLNIEAEPIVKIEEFRVVQMLMGICLNALEAMAGQDERFLVLFVDELSVAENQVESLLAGRYARVSIIDHGEGMSDEVKAKIFEPFYTTRPSMIGKGIGLSLTMAKEIMQKHGGALSFASEPNIGTAIHLYFPLA
jgi:rfaE bifunctional protein nucleotidyltransferase chain/domain